MDSKTVTQTAGADDASAETTTSIAAASDFSPSGAPRQVTDVDVDHPAIDNDPRAGSTDDQNRIDLNDPNMSGEDAVAKALGMKTAADVAAAKTKK